MSSNDDLATVAGHGRARRLELKRVLSGQIERVWEAIASLEELNQWWELDVLEAREGGRVLHEQMGVQGTVKVLQAPYILEFTWDDRNEQPGLVRFDLVQVSDSETQLVLIQYVPESQVLPAAAGWHEIAERLCNYVERGEVIPGSERGGRFEELQRVYASAGVS